MIGRVGARLADRSRPRRLRPAALSGHRDLPVIGADATTFLWQDVGGNNTAIGSPAVSTFVFAGVQGRRDFGGTKVGTTSVTSAPLEE